MADLEKKFCEEWLNTMNSHIEKVSILCNDLKKLGTEYQEAKETYKPLGFNVFALTSDRYYLENYHSDILKALLDPHEKHGEGSLFLEQFLKLLGVDFGPYKDAIVTREKHHIDILIKSESSKHAIIIENKINNAPDTNNQIPNYYDNITGQGYDVDKIVYIPLDEDKSPDKSTWDTSPENEAEIEDLLVIMPAFLLGKEISLNKWIEKCILLSKNIDVISILRQYLKLIEFLRGEIMDYIILGKFYNYLLQDDENLKSAMSIRNMLNDLPSYLAKRILEKYKNGCTKFKKNFLWKEGNCVVFEGYIYNGCVFKIDIFCSKDKYLIRFWEINENKNCNIKSLFSGIRELNDFLPYNGLIYSICKEFSLYEEQELFDVVDALLKNLP